MITGKSVVRNSIHEPGEYSSGTPLTDNRTWRKNAARFKQLDALARRVPLLARRKNERFAAASDRRLPDPELLPHRYPFLLVDRVLELDVEAKRIPAQKNVSINEPFFRATSRAARSCPAY